MLSAAAGLRGKSLIKTALGNSLVVQWLGLVSTFTSMAQVRSLLRGTEIPQAMWDGLITKKVIKLTIKVQTTKEKTDQMDF